MSLSGLVGRVGMGLASIMALAAMVVGVVVLGIWLTVDWLRDAGGRPGFEGEIVFELGISSGDHERIRVSTPACRPADYLVVTVTERDGPTVWEAQADRPTSVDELVIGTAPAGFHELIPLAQALDPSTTYEVELLVGYPGVPGSPTLIGGARSSFEPKDLRLDRTWVGRRLVPPAEYQSIACGVQGSS